MPYGKYYLELNVPIRNVWSFVSDVNNLAPLIPGYVNHEIQSNTRSVWQAKGEVGFVQKEIRMQLDITGIQEPERISFTVTGLNENFSGDGYFKAKKVHDRKTVMTGCLQVTAKGWTGAVLNPVLKQLVPKTTERFTKAVADSIADREPAIT
ncbi:CoxG family protein [Virgibacillus siamensis]|uniref:CoxG family protein n=1 Tax=Virgibacillus siamensis TaxID=480071 RepID=UPI00158D5E80|nr:SRPBCC family protein [Virgibacillus siamensis]